MSVFLERRQRPVHLSMLLLECLALSGLDNPEQTAESLIQDAWRRTGRGKPLTERKVIYIAGRIEQMRLEDEEAERKAEAEAEPKTQKVKPKTLGSDFMEWLSGLTGEQLCLFCADWDLARAEWLYCECDRDDVKALARLRFEAERQGLQVRYESVMYGFGGHYEGDGGEASQPGSGSSSGKVIEFDLTKGGGDGLAKLCDMLKM